MSEKMRQMDTIDPTYGAYDEHLKWCKQRALEILDKGDLIGALTSMTSDMRKHPGTARNAGVELGMMLQINGHLGTDAKMREWIEGFN